MYSSQKHQISQNVLIQKTEQQEICDVIGFILAGYERLEEALKMNPKRYFSELDNLGSKKESVSLLKSKLVFNLKNVRDMIDLYQKNHRSEFPLPNEEIFQSWFKSRKDPTDAEMFDILTNIKNIYTKSKMKKIVLKEKTETNPQFDQDSYDFIARSNEYGQKRMADIQQDIYDNPNQKIGLRAYNQRFDEDKPKTEKKWYDYVTFWK